MQIPGTIFNLALKACSWLTPIMHQIRADLDVWHVHNGVQAGNRLRSIMQSDWADIPPGKGSLYRAGDEIQETAATEQQPTLFALLSLMRANKPPSISIAPPTPPTTVPAHGATSKSSADFVSHRHIDFTAFPQGTPHTDL